MSGLSRQILAMSLVVVSATHALCRFRPAVADGVKHQEEVVCQLRGDDPAIQRRAAFELAMEDALTDDAMLAIAQRLSTSDEYLSSTCQRILLREAPRDASVAAVLRTAMSDSLDSATRARVRAVMSKWCTMGGVQDAAILELLNSRQHAARLLGLQLLAIAPLTVVRRLASPATVAGVREAYSTASTKELADAASVSLALLDSRESASSDDDELRKAVLVHLPRTTLAFSERVEFVANACMDPDPSVRDAAGAALAELATAAEASNSPRLRSVLTALLGDRDSTRRRQAAFGLGYVSGLLSRERTALEMLIVDEDEEVRRTAANSLFTSTSSVQERAKFLTELSASKDSSLRWTSTWIARSAAQDQELRPSALTALLKLTDDPDPEVQRRAVLSLADVGLSDRRTPATLAHVLRGATNDRLRSAALVGIARLGESAKSEVVALRPFLSRRDRIGALAAMADVSISGDAFGEAAINWREFVLKDPDTARAAAGMASGVSNRVVELVFLETLRGMLQRPDDRETAIEACVALTIRHPALLKMLYELRASGDDKTRAAADRGLRLLREIPER